MTPLRGKCPIALAESCHYIFYSVPLTVFITLRPEVVIYICVVPTSGNSSPTSGNNTDKSEFSSGPAVAPCLRYLDKYILHK